MAQKQFKSKNKTKARYANPAGLAAKVAAVEATIKKEELPEFKHGDTLRVHTRIKEGDKERIQVFEGVVIALRNHGAGRSFTVRKVSHGVGVERVYLMNSPKIAKIELMQVGKIRRAKLYYLRELEGKKARIKRDVAATIRRTGTSAASKRKDTL